MDRLKTDDRSFFLKYLELFHFINHEGIEWPVAFMQSLNETTTGSEKKATKMGDFENLTGQPDAKVADALRVYYKGDGLYYTFHSVRSIDVDEYWDSRFEKIR